ncbi:porin family protein [Acidovorax sp. LjRoot194]|uniref:porin family protein n=1 Tax=Acidovorax sp. LjRoot194 TaxID=3342280 RepID=UPI003ECF865C
MRTFFSRQVPLALAVAACTMLSAQAQTSSPLSSTSTSSASGWGSGRGSVLPYTQDGYIGVNGGRSNYSLSNGPAGFGLSQDDSGNAYKIYAGGFFHRNAGVELGYLNAGTSHRLGGDTKAHGFNLSLVGRAPLGEQFDVFGKIGTTYGRTRTSGLAATGVALGKEDGFGLSYGLGARWAFTPQWAAVVEWERHKFKFSDGDDSVNLTTVGVQYRF